MDEGREKGWGIQELGRKVKKTVRQVGREIGRSMKWNTLRLEEREGH